MFSNAQQSIPERFIEKMAVDKEIEAIRTDIDLIISDKIITIEQARQLQQELTPYREKLKPLLEKQDHLRKSCEKFILDQKTRGPTA